MAGLEYDLPCQKRMPPVHAGVALTPGLVGTDRRNALKPRGTKELILNHPLESGLAAEHVEAQRIHAHGQLRDVLITLDGVRVIAAQARQKSGLRA